MKYAPFYAASLLLAALAPAALRPESAVQNLEFRLMAIERRLDQLQSRVDVVESQQRMSGLQSSNPPVALTESVLELQSRQLSQEQQIIGLQQHLLALRKQIDTLAEKGAKEGATGEGTGEEKSKSKPEQPVRRRP
ncbi:MAG: hypothetical protein KIT57_04470 [Blastocatellales bacterium]|nr:hypothetical protein [Blastocatellales bacterium]